MKMHTVEHILEKKNYRKCPLKKRPVNYQFDDEISKRELITTVPTPTTTSAAGVAASEKEIEHDQHEPENLSLKKTLVHSDMESCSDDFISSTITSSINDHETTLTDQIINVSDCCEDEGVEIDHHTDYDETEEDDEMIDCVDIEDNNSNNSQHQTQAAALAAAAAVAAANAAAAAAAVIVPTPTYPKYGLPQPWNFHMSPYTAEFYRTISNPHLAQQISPLQSDLLAPSSPSDSLGSLSPPPSHYMHGRASSVSPPMHTDIIHRPMSVRQLQTPTTTPTTTTSHASLHQHTAHFMPYPLSAFHHHHHHHHSASATSVPGAYPLVAYPGHHPSQHHAPISPAYSESSFYSMRSMTPESNCSSALPEDLSLKQHKSSAKVLPTPAALTTNCKVSLENSPLAAALQTPALGSLQRECVSAKKEKNGPPRYQCPDCQKSYSTFSGLTKHQQFHCPAAEGNQVKKSFSCKDCEKTYVSLGALKMHIRTHTLPCKCNICGKAFSRPWLLQGHIRTHTGEKPFSCQHCHRAFADRSNLRAHLQTHSDIKKYSCSRCSKTFSRMSLLTKHSEGGCPGGANSISSSAMNSSNTSDSFAVFTEQ